VNATPTNMTTLLLSEEQTMLADSARKWVARHGAPTSSEAGDAERWRSMAELGWLALPLPEALGGLGGSTVDLCTLAEALGQAAQPTPWVAAAVLGAGLLAQAAPEAVAAEWAPLLAEGHRCVAFAAFEPGAHRVLSPQLTTAQRTAGGWQLHGSKALVLGGPADAWLLLARLHDRHDELGYFLLPRSAPGLRVESGRLVDGQPVCTLQLQGVQLHGALRTGPAEDLLAMADTAQARATLAHGAELVGAMAQALQLTLDYLKTRRQFGKPIAANQVVQHRLVDLHVQIEEARAITRAAAAVFDGATLPLRRRWCAAAAACVAQAAHHQWEEVLQLHGAIAMTQEHDIGRYIKRLAVGRQLHGDAHGHLARLADLSLPNTD